MTCVKRLPHAFLVLLVALALAPASIGFADEKPAATEAPAAATPAAKAVSTRVPMLWEVDTKPKIYLFGTIHLGDPRVLAHPPAVTEALERSQALYTELEMTQETFMRIVPLLRLPAGETLTQILPPKLHERLFKLFRDKGVPEPVLQAMDQFQPWALQLELARIDIDPALLAKALDKEIFDAAKAAGKTVGGLETIEEQLEIFRGLSREEQVKLLDVSVTGIEKARKEKAKPIEKMIDLYLAGDADNLMKVMLAEMGEGDAETQALSKKMMKRMLDDRNVTMVKRMFAKAEAHPDKTMFVAVGAGHYPGPMGIVELLRKTGFRVRPVKTVADLDKPWPLKWRAQTASRKAPPRRRSRAIRVGPFCIPDPCRRTR